MEHHGRAGEEKERVVKLKPTPAAGVTARDELHRELMFNQRIGKDVLQQKPELKRVLESRKYRKPPEENRTESELQRVHSRIISQQQERGEEQNNN